MSKEAMKLALEALEYIRNIDTEVASQIKYGNAAQIIEAALAEQPAQQEPVAYLCENAVGHKYFRWKKPSSTYKPIALYTSPPAQRKPLTDDELADLWFKQSLDWMEFARAIEAKLKENT